MKLTLVLSLVSVTRSLVPLPTSRARAPTISASARRATRLYAAHGDTPESLLEQAAALRAEAMALEDNLVSEQRAKTEAAIEAAFASADADGDGVVSVAELRAALKAAFVDANENARDSARMAKILAAEQGYVEKAVASLDANGDGVLQIDEFVPLRDLRARLEDAWRLDRADKNAAAQAEGRVADDDKIRAERLDQFEAVSNKTDASARAVSALAYLLPALDILPPPLRTDALLGTVPTSVPGTALDAIQQVNLLYHSIPFSGLLAFVLCSNLASNAAAPRLARFSARHAIVLDLAASVAIPLAVAAGASAPAVADAARPFVGAVILASAAAAALGKEASFVVGTGTLTQKFTDDWEKVIRQVIAATVGAEQIDISKVLEPADDDAGDEKKKED